MMPISTVDVPLKNRFQLGRRGEASFVHTIVSRSSSAVDALREHFLQQLLRRLVDALSVVLSDGLGLAELLVQLSSPLLSFISSCSVAIR